jgi:hypothetical protein
MDWPYNKPFSGGGYRRQTRLDNVRKAVLMGERNAAILNPAILKSVVVIAIPKDLIVRIDHPKGVENRRFCPLVDECYNIL